MATQDINKNPARPLTAKQERYCQLAAVGSYRDAYIGAYDCDPFSVISTAVRELNKDARISLRIRQIQTEAAKPLAISREWLLAWWFGRMTYDPAEITAWAVGCCHHCHGDGHGYQWRAPDYMRELAAAEAAQEPLPDIAGGFGYDSRKGPHPGCPSCDGRGLARTEIADTSALSPAARAAFDGIKETKNGIEIKMADKDVAAINFAKLSGYDVVQVKHLMADIPDASTLDEMARDPMAIAAAYKKMLGTAH